MAERPGNLLDPVPAFNFLIVLLHAKRGPVPTAGFSSCQGLESRMAVEEYQQGGENDRVRKFAGAFSAPNLVLKRGVSLDPLLREWHRSALEGKSPRYDGFVILRNENGVPVTGWFWEKGLMVKLTGPNLDAQSSAVAFESVEIAHERIAPVSAADLPSVSD